MKKLFLNCAFILLCFVIIDNLLVILTFLTSSKLLPLVLPLSLLVSILTFIFLERKANKTDILLPIIFSLLLVGVSIAISVFYFDLSWDGQWYLQSAIYHLENSWNPFLESIKEFEIFNSTPINHFPKSSWYFAASVFSTLGVFEAGKGINFILLFVTILLVYQTLQDYNIAKSKSIILTSIVVLNPVVWSEITTYLVDGLLVLYLTIYITILFAWLRSPNIKLVLIGSFAIVLVINTKFTGLVFFCVLALFFTIYLFFFKRELIIKSIIVHSVILVVSLLIFGYNPYVTNFIERSHPLYPIMGTQEYPSVYEETGQDDNEVYETPHNMQGKHLIVRMLYANFGRPDNAPYYKENDAELIWPFTSKIADWDAYHFHETRVSGFGPYFGVSLIISFLLFLSILIFDKKNRWIALLLVLALLSTLIFSKHFWWPRFAPHFWLVPIIPIIISFYKPTLKKLNFINWVIAALLFINSSIVLISHLGWETRSSIELRKQLTEISNNRVPIQIDYGWFVKSMEEKLDYWGIEYKKVDRNEIVNGPHKRLTSVVEGYPNMVLYKEMN